MPNQITASCRLCGEEKQVYRYSRRCQPCNTIFMREYRKIDPQRIKAQHRKSRLKIYKANPVQRIKDAANRKVARAIARGELIIYPCVVCGSPAQAHHDSYLKKDWLKVRWLCQTHHAEWHRKNKAKVPRA